MNETFVVLMILGICVLFWGALYIYAEFKKDPANISMPSSRRTPPIKYHRRGIDEFDSEDETGIHRATVCISEEYQEANRCPNDCLY